jgi:rhamnulose-1-phosphate aldolase/alcohol dehydrogenase
VSRTSEDVLADLWDDAVSPEDPVDQLLYRSHLLGSDLRITNFAGGNTSCKILAPDAVSGDAREQMWIKGSGGDLGTLRRDGLAVLDVERVRGLERGFRGVEHEDEQVGLLDACLVPPRAAPPSIDTPLHAFVPAAHVDHVHPDALIAFATAENGRTLAADALGPSVGWLEWQRPGYDLGLKLGRLITDHPQLNAVILGGHGLVAWGADARACYRTTIDVINRAHRFLSERENMTAFGEEVTASLPPERRRRQGAAILPMLRGVRGRDRGAICHFRDDDLVLEFACASQAARLAAEGTSCPDHFLRTKRTPLILDVPPETEPAAARERIGAAFDAYRESYATYYEKHRSATSPPMRDANPVVVLWPGVGMFTLGRNKTEARIAAEFYVNAINVMRGAETLSAYKGLSEAEAFRIEYWELEEAKLRRMPPPQPLSGRVALVTGGAGGIGGAIARRLTAEGAAVVIADLDLDNARGLASEIGEQAVAVRLDLTDESSVTACFEGAALAFGGTDILVNNAGITLSRSLTDTTLADYEKVHAVIDRGSFLASQAFARQAEVQGRGGDIVYIVSKNAVYAGPDNVAYGSAKAAQLHQSRLLAAELAPLGIRVNAINPDAVIQGSRIFEGAWGDDRAAKYGVPREKLGEFYAQRSLLKEEVLPEHVADACFALVGGLLPRTTGAVIPVDGGIPGAFPR